MVHESRGIRYLTSSKWAIAIKHGLPYVSSSHVQLDDQLHAAAESSFRCYSKEQGPYGFYHIELVARQDMSVVNPAWHNNDCDVMCELSFVVIPYCFIYDNMNL